MNRLFGLIIVPIFMLFSCSEEDSTFTPSDEFVNSNVKFEIIDTISFDMTTFKVDSLATDLYDKILVGKYYDPIFGQVICNGFANFVPADYNFEDEAVFDSIVLNLGYSGYFYNDTLQQKKIKIYELDEKLDYRNGQANFYNVSNFPESATIGQRSFFPRIAKDSIRTTLNYAFGQNLFQKIRDGVINNNDELSLYFKGLKIAPDPTENASIIGFNISNCYLRFYYSTPEEPDEAKFYDFTYTDFDTNRNHFSQIVCDRSGTILPVNFINQENELSSQSTNNFTFIQAGEGIVTKISFPNFKESMRNLNLNGTIYKANLKIPLNNSYYSENLFTSDSLQVFIVDQNNNVISETKKAYVNIEDAEFNKKYINLIIDPFLENALKNNNYRNYGLMLIPYDYGSVTTRLILNDNYNSEEKSKLILTYLTYDN